MTTSASTTRRSSSDAAWRWARRSSRTHPSPSSCGTWWTRAGADAVRAWGGPASDELARLVPALAPAGDAPEATAGSVGRLFQACCSLFDSISREHPLVLVIEDLHWADRSTRELLALLAHQLRGRILLVLTLRTDEAPLDPGIVRLTAELGRRASDHVTLQPLTRDEQAHQISDILGVPPTRVLLDQVYGRAEGNPFFAEELLALKGASELPPTVRDLLLARLDALAPATRQVLRTGSVIGRTVPHALLAAVIDVGDERLDGALRSAVEEHVLVTVPGAHCYQFRHALLQESFADSLLPGEAARMHRRVAEALEADPSLAGDTSFAAGRVARHWYAAGDGPRALVASVEAAREAKDALAFSESLSHFERALDLLESVPDGDSLLHGPRYQLLRRAAEVAHLAARPGRAAELIRTAIGGVDPADRITDAYLHERLGRYLWMAADGQGAMQAYERAVALLPDGGPTRWRAAVLSGYSQILMLAGRYDESAELAQQAIEMSRKALGARSVEGHARCNLGVVLGMRGLTEEGAAELVLARQIAEEEADDPDDIARAIVNLASIYRDAGRMTEGAEVALEGIRGGRAAGARATQGRLVPLRRRRGTDPARQVRRGAPAAGGGRGARPGRRRRRAHRLRHRPPDDPPRRLRRRHRAPRAGPRQRRAPARRPAGGAAARRAGRAGDQARGRRRGPPACERWRGPAAGVRRPHLRVPAVRRRRGRGDGGRPGRAPSRSAGECARGLVRAGSPRPARAARWSVPYAAAHEATARCEAARAAADDRGADWLAVAAAWDAAPEPYRAAYARIRGAEALLREGDRDLAAPDPRRRARHRIPDRRRPPRHPRPGRRRAAVACAPPARPTTSPTTPSTSPPANARCSRSSPTASPTARSVPACSSATAPSNATSPASWPSSTPPAAASSPPSPTASTSSPLNLGRATGTSAPVVEVRGASATSLETP